MPTASERELENRVSTLEERMTLMERFVQLRYSESYREFFERNTRSSSFKLKGPPNRSSSSIKIKVVNLNQRTGNKNDEISSRRMQTRSSNRKSIPGPASSKSNYPDDSSTPKVRRIDNTLDESSLSSKKDGGKATNSIEDGSLLIIKPENDDSLEDWDSEPLVDMPEDGNSENSNSDADGDPFTVTEHAEDEGDSDAYFTYPTGKKFIGENKNAERSAAFGEDNDDPDFHPMEADHGTDDDTCDPIPTKQKVRPKPVSTSKNDNQTSGSGDIKKTCKKRRVYPRTISKSQTTLTSMDSVVSTDPGTKHCPLCNKYFKLKYFNSHMEQHRKERHLKCSYCEKTFFNASMLNKHQRLHQRDKYGKKCRMCDFIHVESHKLLCHERFCLRRTMQNGVAVDPEIVENIRQRSVGIDLKLPTDSDSEIVPPGKKKCQHCSAVLDLANYKSHMDTHVVKRWKCNKCDKEYAQKSNLVVHIRLTHEITPTCEMCQTTFSDRATLVAHAVRCRLVHKKKQNANNVEVAESNSKNTDESSSPENDNTSSADTKPSDGDV